jgi:hypothetical protein
MWKEDLETLRCLAVQTTRKTGAGEEEEVCKKTIGMSAM